MHNIKTAVELSRVRHYHSGNHMPYRGMLHDVLTDVYIDWGEKVREILADLPEGVRVSIDVKVELPVTEVSEDDIWVLLKPHEYGHFGRSRELP
jgi:hypothetical protein